MRFDIKIEKSRVLCCTNCIEERMQEVVFTPTILFFFLRGITKQEQFDKNILATAKAFQLVLPQLKHWPHYT